MSWKWVDKFLGGSKPQAATMRKLTEWYIRWAENREDLPSPETLRAAAALLVRHLPPPRQLEAAQRVVTFAQSLESS
jgi:hypothetical protein